jgi:hypothetical protein
VRVCVCRLPVRLLEALQSGSTLNRHQVDRRVLASSIDFKVEFELVAFVQFPQARTLNRADMHECVRLAVITRDKAEALHSVEELDRASRFLARKLTLRSSWFCSNGDHIANDLKVGCGDLATTIDEVEFQRLTFSQAFKTCAFDSADVNEHILTTVFTRDEAEALLAVEKLDDTLAGTDDLSRHSAATAAAATWAAEAATAAAASAAEAAATAAEAAAITATEAATITTAKAAAAIAAAAETVTAAKAATVTKTAAAKAAAATAAVGIEAALVAKTVALVSAATAPPSVKTHRNQ